jgi:hypothetical protein
MNMVSHVNLPPQMQTALDQTLKILRDKLGENLYSCILYGSSVRGNVIPGVSDINLMVVLNESTPQAHQVVAQAIQNKVTIEPFVLGRDGIERSIQAFAIKFRSIARNYQVLHGVDLLAGLTVDETLLHFLCEQALRNLRLRLVHHFVTIGSDRKHYSHYLRNIVPSIFTDLSEVLRFSGSEIPKELSERIPLMESRFNIDGAILRDLLSLRKTARDLKTNDIVVYHSKLFHLINQVIRWIESQWPPLKTSVSK